MTHPAGDRAKAIASLDVQHLLEGLERARRTCAALTSATAKHAELARLLATVGEHEEARAVLREAIARGGGRAEDYEAIAFAAFGLNEHELARDCYAQVSRLAPGDALARYNLASAERNLGHLGQAEVQCDAALERDPNLFQAALLRSQLRTQRVDTNHVEWLRDRLARNSHLPSARIFLNYALGKELEDLGAHDEAFAHFQEGATARRRTLDYDVARDLHIMRRIEDEYLPTLLNAAEAPKTVGPFGFVLGLPRSGTTLIERILTGHPGVRSNGETDNFSTALLQAVKPGEGDLFARAVAADPMAVAVQYRKLAGPVSQGLILEKLPLNYLYAGAIARALPDAPIVLVSRDPIDNCLAMYTTLFGSAYPFSYDLEELASYHAGYARLIRHWRAHLGSRLLEVSYEALVHDPELWGQRLASHVGVDWRPEALQVEKNPTASTTASAVQVRRPIYRFAAGRWRHYEAHLGELIDRLSTADGVH